MDNNSIEAIGKVGKSGQMSPGVEAVNSAQAEAATKEQFDTAMTAEATTVAPVEQVTQQARQPSLMDHVREMNTSGAVKINPEGLAVQTDELISKIGQLKESLQNPNLQLKSSTQNLMENKLEHIDNNLKVALSKAGLEVGDGSAANNVASQRVNPIDRFLGFLTDGQAQLENLGGELQGMSKEQISPTAMMTIQIKVTQITQEIELFTSLLNKSLESIKTIMNVQV